MVCINIIVNVKQKQTWHECGRMLKCEYDVSISDVSVREPLHFIVDAGSLVYNYDLQYRIISIERLGHWKGVKWCKNTSKKLCIAKSSL